MKTKPEVGHFKIVPKKEEPEFRKWARDNFKPDGSDFVSPGVAGNYRINVSFKTGKYTFTKL